MIRRIEAETALSGEESASNGRHGGLGIGGSRTIGRLKIAVVISMGIVKMSGGRGGGRGVIRLPEGTELP